MRKLFVEEQANGRLALCYVNLFLMMALFFLLIKAAAYVNEESRKISDSFHKYILKFDLNDRTAEFDRQVKHSINNFD